jgi:hypothetical protein
MHHPGTGQWVGQSSPSMLALTAAPCESKTRTRKRTFLRRFSLQVWLRPLAFEVRSLMNCHECRDLYRAFERRTTHYLEARSAAFFQVSTQIAVSKLIAMQRALSDLREHQADCPWAHAANELGQRFAT